MELSLKLSEYSGKKYLDYIKTQSLDNLHHLKLYLDDIYYNTEESVFDDKRYDILKEFLSGDPNYVPPVGAKIRVHENRVTLPFWLGSASKITPDEPGELDRWIKKNPNPQVIVTEKLDGVSGMFIQKGGKRKLYTRGDGVVGADISYLIQYITGIPDFKEDIAIRGELIMEKKIFESKYKKGTESTSSEAKAGTRTYKHSRNMISGLVGAKTVRNGLNDIKFIVYEIIGDDTMFSPIKQLKKLSGLGFTTAMYEKIDFPGTPGKLTKLHKKFKAQTKFEIDGIVVQSNVQYDRNITGNPSYLLLRLTDLKG